MANDGRMCRRAEPLFCQAQTNCTGTSIVCPPTVTLTDGTISSENDDSTCNSGFCTASCPPDYEQCSCGGRPATDEYIINKCSMCCRPKKKFAKVSCNLMIPYHNVVICYVTLNETIACACREGICEKIDIKPSPQPNDDDTEHKWGNDFGFWGTWQHFIVTY